MTTINELTVKAFNKELDEMLDAFAKKHGLSKGAQRIVYARDGSTMKFTVEFGDKATTGGVNPVFFKNTARFGRRYGFETSMIGQELNLTRLGKVKFVGMSSPKFAIVETADRRLFKYEPTIVASLLLTAAAVASAKGKL
jgi:hypothetical protein